MENSNKKSNRFSIYVYIELVSAILFALFCFSAHADISLLARPVALAYTAITVYFCFFKVLLKKDAKRIPVILRLTQYLPFVLLFCFVVRRAGKNGVPYWYDVVTVILWCFVFIFSLVLSYCMNEKRIIKITENWNVPYTKKKKLKGRENTILFKRLSMFKELSGAEKPGELRKLSEKAMAMLP